jgi:hypothetical protein
LRVKSLHFPHSCCKLLLGLDEWELGAELEIDHGLDAAIDLEEGGSGLAGNNLVEDGNVPQTKLGNLGVDVERTLGQANRLVVGHRAPSLCIFLDEGIFCVVNFNEVGHVLIINGPEFGGLIRSEGQIRGDERFLLCAKVLTKESDILVDLLLLAGGWRLRRGGLRGGGLAGSFRGN